VLKMMGSELFGLVGTARRAVRMPWRGVPANEERTLLDAPGIAPSAVIGNLWL
jgi:hypothetical protein